MRTIDWRSDEIVIIDQTALPAEERLLHLRTVEELVDAIGRLAVRGAMALGVAGALGVALAACRAEEEGADVRRASEDAAARLAKARPTAVNLSWGAKRVAAVAAGGRKAMVAEALRVLEEDVAANRAIGERGAALLDGRHRILTHCNAGALAGTEWGTALSIIRVLHDRGAISEIFVSETRPLLQGARLTAWELGRMGVPHRVVVDGAGAGLILAGRVDAVIVGADRIARNGDVANKVGTVAHALAARRAGIPFIVAAPESTFDPDTASGAAIAIEERDPNEVLCIGGVRIAPERSGALNLAFDVTPVDLVTAIVTESRVIYPGIDPILARP
ncbi:MAG: S-methyl-5-thioribose-1-phosphate isomerase [Chloroflexota bacterium]